MKLETRVETLEHELKILKNEIQSTLLEIQSQILEHYYASLRAEQSLSDEDRAPRQDAPAPEKRDGPKIKETLRPRRQPTAADEENADFAPISPKLKEVSLSQFREKQVFTPMLFLQLTEWVNATVVKIGKANTQQTIESYTDDDACAPEVKALLIQLVTFSSEEQPPATIEPKAMLEALLGLNKLLATLPK